MELSRLKEPFGEKDIEWRLQQCGEKNGKIWARCLAYVTARAIESRLDEVCGSENWKNEFRAGPDGGILCGISIKCGGEWVTKWDGAENTQVESVKGGLSDAMKRAGVQWGIGRYLYDLDEGWATVCDDGIYHGKTRDDKWFRWNPPGLPGWALPNGDGKSPSKRKAPGKGGADSARADRGEDAGGKAQDGGAASAEGQPGGAADIKSAGDAIIKRIGLVMRHQENGRSCFTEAETDNIRALVAGTRLNDEGIRELLELESVVKQELDSRLARHAGSGKAA